MNSKRGVALAVSLMSMAFLTTLATAFVMVAMQEKRMYDVERSAAKALYAAESGAHAALNDLDIIINRNMRDTVRYASNPSVVASNMTSYVNAANSLGMLVAYVKNDGVALLSQDGAQAIRTGTRVYLEHNVDTTADFTTYITQKSPPIVVSANVWDFSFFYKVQSTGQHGSQVRKVCLYGDFVIRVQKDSFTRYALFTNRQTMPNGTQVWFTSTAYFAGPLFTNGQYNYAYNPGGTFLDTVAQHLTRANFYNRGNQLSLDANANGTIDVPTFTEGFERGVPTVSTPTDSSSESTMVVEAIHAAHNPPTTSDLSPYSNTGIYLPVSGSTLTGGIYVTGNASISTRVVSASDMSDPYRNTCPDCQAITITSSNGVTKNIALNRSTNTTLVATGNNAPVTYTGLPDGASNIGTLIYVKGNITALSGTVESNNQMTIAASNSMTINNNLRYESYTPASGTPGTASYVPPSAEGYNNVLGLISWNGDVNIAAPNFNNLDIHATVMAPDGIFTVINYDSISPRGVATILGGVITDSYGAFGTFNSSDGSTRSGYTRNFTYDTRMESRMAPPYFPTMNAYIPVCTDIADKLSWQQGGF